MEKEVMFTPEEEALLEKLEAKKKAISARRKTEIDNYNQLKDETVEKVFARLQRLSIEMENAKQEMLKEFAALQQMKCELYDVPEKQVSHNWTTSDGLKTIITGFNCIDRWDDTAKIGIEKINMWLESQVSNENKNFVSIIRDLLKPNREGELKANRILDLQNQAEKIGDAELLNAVTIIREAHRPDRTSSYIKAKYRDGDGTTKWVGLSMSAV